MCKEGGWNTLRESLSLGKMVCEDGNNEVRNTRQRSIHVQLPEGNVFTYEVDRNEKAGALKRRVQAQLTFCTEQAELVFAGQVLENNSELSEVMEGNSLLLRSPGLHRSQSTPCLTEGSPKPEEKELAGSSPQAKPIVTVGCLKSCKAVENLVRSANYGLESGVNPVAEGDGLGGAYYFKDHRGKNLGIVKPTDEEPLAPNNPKGYVGRQLGDPGFKRSVRVGEAATREVAAYLLDHQNFSRVPLTFMVKAKHPIFNVNKQESGNGLLSPTSAAPEPPAKLASFQDYVYHDYDANEHSSSRFPVAEVHSIGILDIRLFNTDRHSGNILVRKPKSDAGSSASNKSLAVKEKRPVRSALNFQLLQEDSVELIPIDHGYCLPEKVEGVYFEWLYWPQASQPFSQEELAYIASLDAKGDVQKLRRELPNIREASLRLLEVSTTILQKGAAAGLSLADLGNILSRPLVGTDEEASEMEILCSAALLETQERTADAVGLQGYIGSDDETSDVSDDSPSRSRSLLSVQSVSEDLLQFDLDDEGVDCAIPSPSRSFDRVLEDVPEHSTHLPSSPGSPSWCYNTSDSASSSPSSPVGCHSRGIAMPQSTGQMDSMQPKMASSMCVGGGQRQMLRFAPATKQGNYGASGWQRRREPASKKDIRLGDLSEEQWEVFRSVFACGIDCALKERNWKSSMQLVTTEGSRLQTFGTSCPQL